MTRYTRHAQVMQIPPSDVRLLCSKSHEERDKHGTVGSGAGSLAWLLVQGRREDRGASEAGPLPSYLLSVPEWGSGDM